MLSDDLLREIAQAIIDQAEIPSSSGALAASHRVEADGEGRVRIVSSLPYAGAVHNGRRELVIRPNLSKNPRPAAKARLRFEVAGKIIFAREVRQPARPANPYLVEAFPRAVESIRGRIVEAYRSVLWP